MDSGIGGRGSRDYGRGSRGRMRENQSYKRNRGYNDGVDRNLGSIKLKIPQFQGNLDPKAYLQ